MLSQKNNYIYYTDIDSQANDEAFNNSRTKTEIKLIFINNSDLMNNMLKHKNFIF